ncbi:MAG: competence/damage-inducible protein A [Saprospiraceae bacterium]|nr:competence/damage-inducible protein A [Saprospiraceae bacterium]MCB9324996.1 competence/damage-inducible protein A [Lewinellaceae bacterium]
MKVSIVTIGDEILIGQIVDTNSAWMAQQLNLAGAKVVKIITTSDGHDEIIQGIQQAQEVADVVLITGGLGPTKDDITKKAIADLLGNEMVFSQITYDRISGLLKKWGIQQTEGHKAQCFMPSSALLLENKMGTAPGMWFDLPEQVIVSMPGVPYEMKYLMEHEVIPRLVKRFNVYPIIHRTILTSGIGESVLADKISSIEDALPGFIKLAYLPGLAQVRLRLSARAENGEDVQKAIDEEAAKIVEMLSEFVYGYENQTLQEVVLECCRAKGLKLSTAESCTGGYVSHLLTTIPGSSDAFEGGVVSYSNALKMNLLNVNPETLEQHGAVSEETVIEMAKGARESLGTDIAVSISGIAGPGGGTPEKPVGTVWICVSNENHIFTRKLELTKDRVKNIQYSANIALTAIWRFILKHY